MTKPTDSQTDSAIQRFSAPDEIDPNPWFWVREYAAQVQVGDVIRVRGLPPCRVTSVRVIRRNGVLRYTLRLHAPIKGSRWTPRTRTLTQVEQVLLRVGERAAILPWSGPAQNLTQAAIPSRTLAVDSHGRLAWFGPDHARWLSSSNTEPLPERGWSIPTPSEETADIATAYRALWSIGALQAIRARELDIDVHRYACSDHCGPGPRFIVRVNKCPAAPDERVVPLCYNLRSFMESFVELEGLPLTGIERCLHLAGGLRELDLSEPESESESQTC